MSYTATDLGTDAPTALGGSVTLQASKILAGARSQRVITEARRIVAAAGLMRNASPADLAAALYDAQRAKVAFVPDPLGDELIVDAETLLCLKGEGGACVPAGDCDDQNVVLGAMLVSLGIPVRIMVGLPFEQPGQQAQAHVWLEYDGDWRQTGDWRCIDPSEADGMCRMSGPFGQPLYAEVVPFDVREFADGGKMISMGHPASYRTGDAATSPPAASSASTQLPDDQAAAWTQMLEQAGQHLADSAASLSDWSARYARIRGELELPQFDPSPATAPDGGPLLAYVNGGGWTLEAAQAEAKLLQAATMITGAINDALEGKRPIYWQDGDLGVGALNGDVYAVLMKPNAAGTLVAAYIDLQSGTQTGTTGNPILIGIAIVVVTIAAVYAVDKVVEYLAQAHRDDAVTKIADAQQALVQSGKATPDQAAAFLQAAKDMASAPGPANSADANPAWPWGKLLGAAGLGIAGGVIVSQLLGRVFGSPVPILVRAPAAA